MNDKILRWSVPERAEHLLVLILMLAFIITGLPLFSREWFGWMVLSPIAIDVFREIHRLAAGIYAGVGIFHVSYHTLVLRKTEIGISAKDITDSIALMKYYFGLSGNKPKIGFHNPAEKILVYWLVAVVFMLFMGASGVILVFPWYFSPWIHEWALIVHDLFFILILVVVMFHFYMSVLYKEHRPLLDGMFTDGMVQTHYINENHPLWYGEIQKKT